MTKTITIHSQLHLALSDIELSFIRSPGPGGQNVNKVATSVQLRFNLAQSGLPEDVKARAAKLAGSRLTEKGDILIKASAFRTQERNKIDAINRLVKLLQIAATPPKKRKKTKPPRQSIERRLANKKQRSKQKQLRQKTGE